MEQRRIDWPSFGVCVAIIIVVCVTLAAFPETAGDTMRKLYEFIATELGIFYLIASVAAISFLVWLAASRFGLSPFEATARSETERRLEAALARLPVRDREVVGLTARCPAAAGSKSGDPPHAGEPFRRDGESI